MKTRTIPRLRANHELQKLQVFDARQSDVVVVLERVGVAAAVVHELADLRVLEEPGEAGGRDRASEQAALDDLSGTSIAIQFS